jgi:hypothetical protein
VPLAAVLVYVDAFHERKVGRVARRTYQFVSANCSQGFWLSSLRSTSGPVPVHSIETPNRQWGDADQVPGPVSPRLAMACETKFRSAFSAESSGDCGGNTGPSTHVRRKQCVMRKNEERPVVGSSED